MTCAKSWSRRFSRVKQKKDTEPNKRFAATAVSVRKESKRNECKKGRKYLNDASSILIWAHAFGFLLIYVWGHYMAILYVWNWQRTLKSSCNSNQNANEPKSKEEDDEAKNRRKKSETCEIHTYSVHMLTQLHTSYMHAQP